MYVIVQFAGRPNKQSITINVIGYTSGQHDDLEYLHLVISST